MYFVGRIHIFTQKTQKDSDRMETGGKTGYPIGIPSFQIPVVSRVRSENRIERNSAKRFISDKKIHFAWGIYRANNHFHRISPRPRTNKSGVT